MLVSRCLHQLSAPTKECVCSLVNALPIVLLLSQDANLISLPIYQVLLDCVRTLSAQTAQIASRFSQTTLLRIASHL